MHLLTLETKGLGGDGIPCWTSPEAKYLKCEGWTLANIATNGLQYIYLLPEGGVCDGRFNVSTGGSRIKMFKIPELAMTQVFEKYDSKYRVKADLQYRGIIEWSQVGEKFIGLTITRYEDSKRRVAALIHERGIMVADYLAKDMVACYQRGDGTLIKPMTAKETVAKILASDYDCNIFGDEFPLEHTTVTEAEEDEEAISDDAPPTIRRIRTADLVNSPDAEAALEAWRRVMEAEERVTTTVEAEAAMMREMATYQLHARPMGLATPGPWSDHAFRMRGADLED